MEGHFPFILTICAGAISLALGIWSSLKNEVKPMTLSGTTVCTFLYLIFIYGQNNKDYLAILVGGFILTFAFSFMFYLISHKAFHYFSKQFSFTCYVNGVPILVNLLPLTATLSVSLSAIYQLYIGTLPLLQVLVVLLLFWIYPLGIIEAISTFSDFMTQKQFKLESGKNKTSYQCSFIAFLVAFAVMLLYPFNWLIYNIAVLAYAILLLKYYFFHHTLLCLSLVTLISLIDAVFPVHEVGLAPVGLITCSEILFSTHCVTAFEIEYLFVPGLLISCICHYEKYRVPDRLKILISSEKSKIRVGIPENEEELVQERQKIILIAAFIGYVLSSFAVYYFSFLSKCPLLTLTIGTSILPLIALMLLYWPEGELLQFIMTDSHQEIIDQLSHAFQKSKGSDQPKRSKGQRFKNDIEIATKRSLRLPSPELSSSSITVSTDNSHVLKIFRPLMADFANALAHDPIIYLVSDRLFSHSLISAPVHKDINTTLGVSLHIKASKLVNEVYRQLNSHNEPVQYLTDLCDALDLVEDQPLQSVVANKIKMFLSN
ncbi:PREDICTED: uncharacterized protein LOC109585817 [Amphimedon queenslandica]|uniref:Uncharacterized protein n=1 Tax=Amphimedon queenslandica TaxID=400682 RepID=A0AAN0JL52_AMPQE|nr:PREDICTED: uncharacterized protein LOC109585817 [Amphimedon queenslandica]|eukprot:XP_019857519.1 PREDICTED: uncharacterized protein LOC109585817 [Amphimedon queenslandica]